MAAVASRTFAAVILNNAPPFRSRAGVEASPAAVVKGELRPLRNPADDPN
jgi:hypothetical protein